MPAEVPKASFLTEASIHKQVESIDAKEGRVTLAPWKYIESWVAEPDVAHNIRGWQLLLDGLRDQERVQILQKCIDGLGSLDHLRRVEFDL